MIHVGNVFIGVQAETILEFPERVDMDSGSYKSVPSTAPHTPYIPAHNGWGSLCLKT